MYCQKCGTKADSGASFCGNCGQSLGSQQTEGSPQNTSSGQAASPSLGQRVAAWVVGPIVVIVGYAIYTSLGANGLSAEERGYVNQCRRSIVTMSTMSSMEGNEHLKGVENLDSDRFCSCVLEELRSTTTDNEYAIIIGADPDTIDYSEFASDSDPFDLVTESWDAWARCGFSAGD